MGGALRFCEKMEENRSEKQERESISKVGRRKKVN